MDGSNSVLPRMRILRRKTMTPIEGLYTTPEIAAMLGLTENNVRQRLYQLGIRPVRRVGITGLYERSAVEAVRARIGKVGKPKEE